MIDTNFKPFIENRGVTEKFSEITALNNVNFISKYEKIYLLLIKKSIY